MRWWLYNKRINKFYLAFYLPEYNSKIILENTDIKLINSKFDLIAESEGLIKIKDNFDKFKIKKRYNYNS